MGTRTVGELVVDVPVLGIDETVGGVEALLEQRPDLDCVVIRGGNDHWVVDRTSLGQARGRYGDEWSTYQAVAVAGHRSLEVARTTDLLELGRLLAARPEDAHFEDVLVFDVDESYLGVLPLSTAVAELGRLFELQARHDMLTGLPNRALFADHLAAALSRVRRENADGEHRRVGLFVIRLQGMPAGREGRHHAARDRVFLHTAQRLRDVARGYDLVGRTSGDEFVVLLDLPDDDLDAVAHRLYEQVSRPIEVLEMPAVTLDAAIGAAASDGETTAEDFLANSDRMVERARRSPVPRVVTEPRVDPRPASHAPTSFVVASTSTAGPAAPSGVTQTDLRRALTNGQLAVHYQPIVDLATLQVVRVEALARWIRPDGEQVPPTQFIAVADAHGMIGDLGRFVIETALGDLTGLDTAVGVRAAPRSVAVNLSPVQCRDSSLATTIDHIVANSGLTPVRLSLEVNERTITRPDAAITATLNELGELGCDLAIDSYGTGGSDPGRLTELPVTHLKISRTYIAGFVNEKAQREIVSLVAALGREHRLRVCGEGIETDEQVRLLRLVGADEGQGYRFGRPMPIDELVVALSRSSRSLA